MTQCVTTVINHLTSASPQREIGIEPTITTKIITITITINQQHDTVIVATGGTLCVHTGGVKRKQH